MVKVKKVKEVDRSRLKEVVVVEEVWKMEEEE